MGVIDFCKNIVGVTVSINMDYFSKKSSSLSLIPSPWCLNQPWIFSWKLRNDFCPSEQRGLGSFPKSNSSGLKQAVRLTARSKPYLLWNTPTGANPVFFSFPCSCLSGWDVRLSVIRLLRSQWHVPSFRCHIWMRLHRLGVRWVAEHCCGFQVLWKLSICVKASSPCAVVPSTLPYATETQECLFLHSK